MYEEKLDFCSSIYIDMEVYLCWWSSVSYEWELLSIRISQRQLGCYGVIYYFFSNLLGIKKAT